MKQHCIILFCLISVISGVVIPDEIKAMIQSYHEECNKISKLDQGTIDSMKSGTFDDTDAAVRKHIFCFLKKADFINDNGDLQETVMRIKMSIQVPDGALVDKAMKNCIIPKTGDVEKWACKILACFYKTAPGIMIL